MMADLGGTDLLTPLREVLQSQSSLHRVRQIFLISDGAVESRTECIEFASKYSNTTRIFSFGIGDLCDKYLTKAIAKASCGASEFIKYDENQDTLNHLVTKQLLRSMKASYTNVKCTIHGVEGVPLRSPYKLPPMFHDEQYIVYWILDGDQIKNKKNVEIEFTAHYKGNTDFLYSKVVDIDGLSLNNGSNLFHSVASNEIIKQLEIGELRNALGTDRADVYATQLALCYGLVSNKTSYIAVNEAPAVESSDVDKSVNIVIPLELRCGSGNGVFCRLPDMTHDVLSDHLSVDTGIVYNACQPKITPFGFLSKPCQVGYFTHVFKGPVADLEGRNCWLNSILPLLTTITPLVNQITSEQHQRDTFLFDLSLLLRLWISMDHDNFDFRRQFDFMYNRVWFHIQRMGFEYGTDQDVCSVLNNILRKVNVRDVQFITKKDQIKTCSTSHVVLLNVGNDKVDENDYLHYSLKSFISFVEFTTKKGTKIGHSSCVCPEGNGFFYYDDILNLGEKLEQYNGGYVNSDYKEFFNNEIMTAAVLCRKGNNACHKVKDIESDVANLIDVVSSTRTDINKELLWQPDSSMNLHTCLDVLRQIRFSCCFETDFVVKNKLCKSRVSENKLRIMIGKELLKISESQRPIYGLHMVCSKKILNSVIKLPPSVNHGRIDFRSSFDNMDRETTGIGRLAKLLVPFEDITYQARGKNSRKKKSVPIAEYILK
ncbi:hypothetical protein AKO1_007728 [Acrasis kona]|uniref:VWFA domain-containing protein n=1 Tax=Acrasis kona TaxID=1008807 RepID=A0AAW2YRJ3_9EUKA